MTERRFIPVLREWPGYTGKFIREQAMGAIPNGQRIVKARSHNRESVRDGDMGVILGSIDVEACAPVLAKRFKNRFIYFVEWDATPGRVAGVRDFRVRQLS